MDEQKQAPRDVILSVKDLVVKFSLRGKELTALRGISLDLYKGESLATFYGTPDKFAAAAEEYRSGLVYGDTQPEEAPLVYALVTKDGVERY